MTVIYKYQIETCDHEVETKLKVPPDSILLGIDVQKFVQYPNRRVFAWFEVNETLVMAELESRVFVCMYTGSNFDNSDKDFIKSVVVGETLVVHIYEKKKFLDKGDFNID